MYLEIFLADFAVFRVFLGISRDFAEIPEFRGSATARNIRSPAKWDDNPLADCLHVISAKYISLGDQFCLSRSFKLEFVLRDPA